MEILSTLVMLVVAAGILAWMTSPRTGQALDAWASGFIGYRGAGWPRGVQEEEPVHFRFSEGDRPESDDDDGPARFDEEAEIVELDGPPDGEVRVHRIR